MKNDILFKVTAFSLLRTYKKQFQKLIALIVRDYMPKVKRVSMKGAGGPVTRLEGYLESITKLQVSQPKGFLGQHFWMT